MRSTEFLTEGLNHPIICVDVQPSYSGMYDGDESPVFLEIMQFVQKQTGPVLFFVNAETTGVADDTVQGIQQYWDDSLGDPGDESWDENDEYHYTEPSSPIDWRRFTMVDKGYGYLRAWMDNNVPHNIIIQTIREMYKQKVTDTRDLEFSGNIQERTPMQSQIMRVAAELGDDNMTIGWTSVAQLKRFNGAYLVGGGREECLKEVELLMNAFNIRYKRVDSLVYG